MLYSEVLQHPEIAKRLKAAGVDHLESAAMAKGDFLSFDKIDSEVINVVSDNEILYRRRFVEYQKQLNELDEKLKPFKLLEAKAEFIKPFFEKLIDGKFEHPYSTAERGAVIHASKKAAKEFDFDPANGEVQSENLSLLSELQKLLRQASIVNLSGKMTLDEITLRVFHDCGYSGFLKK